MAAGGGGTLAVCELYIYKTRAQHLNVCIHRGQLLQGRPAAQTLNVRACVTARQPMAMTTTTTTVATITTTTTATTTATTLKAHGRGPRVRASL